MKGWAAILAALIIVSGCAQAQREAFQGPPSLRLVPADFYSREPLHRPGPRPGPDAAPKRAYKRGDDGSVTVLAPEPEESEAEGSSLIPADTATKLEQLNDQLQQLRRTITRAKKPPT